MIQLRVYNFSESIYWLIAMDVFWHYVCWYLLESYGLDYNYCYWRHQDSHVSWLANYKPFLIVISICASNIWKLHRSCSFKGKSIGQTSHKIGLVLIVCRWILRLVRNLRLTMQLYTVPGIMHNSPSNSTHVHVESLTLVTVRKLLTRL